jgi:hypothetical protein
VELWCEDSLFGGEGGGGWKGGFLGVTWMKDGAVRLYEENTGGTFVYVVVTG